MPLPVTEDDGAALPVHKVGRQAAPFVGCGLAALILLAGLVNAFSRDGENGAFADACANELLDRMGTRTWLITDGLLDPHLRVAAAARGQELNIICIKALKEADYKAYCRQIADLIEEKGVSAGEKKSGDLAFTLRELGMVEFLKMWFSSDPDITKEVAVFRLPDFWFWAKCRPVPECLFFGGVADVKSVDGVKAKEDFEAFWKKMEPVLVADRRQGSRAIRELSDQTDRCRLELRRHLGFIANNLGVLLQDLGDDAGAFEMYELVLGTIDCDNICALFNEYEMARAGKKEVQARKREIEQQLKGIVDDASRRYQLRPLSSYYGYIRSTEFFVRSGLHWARSGETGYALEQIRYAIDLTSSDAPPKELLNMMASYYAQGRQVVKSREKYQEVLAKDANNHEALIGLWRLSLQEGAVDEAKSYLERAVKAPVQEETARFDVALLHMMNNKLEDARLTLQKITDLQPHSIQAWALLAGVVLQQADKAQDAKQKQKILAEVDNAILPKMEALSDSPRDFFVQMTRALTLMRKGTDAETMKQTRTALELAWMSRPVVSVGGMVLDLDYRLLDRESAERHALQILRMDAKHAFANWVMGSIRMEEGKSADAEKFLRAAVGAARPLPSAQNDLAELLRRKGDLAEAEKFARAATRSDPKLYVSWETLCATLLDQGKDLDEAERCIQKAIELSEGKDLRMQLTLARVQLAPCARAAGEEGPRQGARHAPLARQAPRRARRARPRRVRRTPEEGPGQVAGGRHRARERPCRMRGARRARRLPPGRGGRGGRSGPHGRQGAFPLARRPVLRVPPRRTRPRHVLGGTSVLFAGPRPRHAHRDARRPLAPRRLPLPQRRLLVPRAHRLRRRARRRSLLELQHLPALVQRQGPRRRGLLGRVPVLRRTSAFSLHGRLAVRPVARLADVHGEGRAQPRRPLALRHLA